MQGKPLEVDLLVAGAGHAAGVFAPSVRQLGFSGSMLLVGQENHLPYERPALSKELLRDVQYVHPPILNSAQWKELHVQLLLGRRVVAVDGADHVAHLDDGARVKWQRLVIATGARPRRSPGPAHSARHVIRTVDDALAIRAQMAQRRNPSIVIIGGGPVGLEAAASLRPQARAITVVESADRLMSRVAPAEIGEAIAKAHRENDVTVLFRTTVTEMIDRGDMLDIILSNGNNVSADVLIEGIGVVPEVPLVGSHLPESGNGISVDQHYATAHPGIFAIGDVACVCGNRQETWAHAESSGRAAARSVMGLPPEALPVPSFWSDQFSRIQIAGDATQGAAAGYHGRAHLYHKDGIIVAVAAIGAPRDFAAARRLIGRPLER